MNFLSIIFWSVFLFNISFAEINEFRSTVLKFSTKEKITGYLIKDNKFLVESEKTLKLYDIDTGDLLYTINAEFRLEPKLVDFNRKSYVVTAGERNIMIFDFKTGKNIKNQDFDRYIQDFDVYQDKVFILNLYKLTTYNYIKNRLHEKDIKYSSRFTFSKDYKYFITNNCDIYYNTGEYIKQLSGNCNTRDTKWINRYLVAFASPRKFVSIKNIKTDEDIFKIKNVANLLNKQYKKNNFYKILHVDDNYIVFTEKNYIIFHNWKKDKPIAIYKVSKLKNITNGIMNKDYIAVSYINNGYIFKIPDEIKSIIFNNKEEINKKEEMPKVSISKIDKSKTKINQKPKIKLVVSRTEGYAPLNVSINIVAKDEDGKIVAYYLNINGKEYMGDGIPIKAFKYTFYEPGTYKIFSAVKDDKGAISTTEVIINVKEETFEDYKKIYGY